MNQRREYDIAAVRKRMVAARQAAGLSLRQLAADLGVSGARVGQIETQQGGVSLSTVLAWADATQVCPAWLIWGADAARVLREHPLPDGCAPMAAVREATFKDGKATAKAGRKRKGGAE